MSHFALSVISTLGFLLCAHTSLQSAYTIQVVPTYDENATQTNAVDFSATNTTGNQISWTDFTSLVSQAYAAGLGGVLNFDTGGAISVKPNVLAPQDFLIAKYGTNFQSTLNIGNSTVTDMLAGTDVTNRVPISGNRYLGKSGTAGEGLSLGGAGGNFIFEFSAADRVVAVGGTLLSRSDTGGNTTGKVTFSDGTFAQVAFNQTASYGQSDVFYGFQTTLDQQAQGIYITQYALLLPSSHFRGFDDLAFVIAPEPSKGLLILSGIALLGLKRRRVHC